MKLNRYQIIKELEGLVKFSTCPEYIKDALALIKAMAEDYTKLDEKYRALYDECERLKKAYAHYEETTGLKQVRADTVQKLQDSIAVHFGTYTDKDTVKVVEVFKLLERVGREILEGEKGR